MLMTISTVKITYGDYNHTCQVCYKPRTRFGLLVDPNGHSWRVCQKCIDRLWRKRHAKREEDILGG